MKIYNQTLTGGALENTSIVIPHKFVPVYLMNYGVYVFLSQKQFTVITASSDIKSFSAKCGLSICANVGAVNNIKGL